MKIFIIVGLFRCLLADLILNTSTGPVRGVSSLADDVEAFLGIPYAEPPIDELRFAKTVPKQPWSLTYNASSLPPPCPQIDLGPYYFMPDITNMSEDCLYLNMWIPKPELSPDLKPVIIFIHPGAFIAGSSNLKAHDGSNLASRGNLVVVTINYRLGTLGYFLAHSEEAEGNMGMYDQVMAIKWVKENARLFGGDPENIVLMGVSAGAYSVSAHMVSPLSKNLFKKAILHSGSLVHPVFGQDNAKLHGASQSIASLVGCTNASTTLKDDPHSVMKCLRNTPVKSIIEAEKNIFQTNPMLFFPRVNDTFLPKSVTDLLREGKFREDVEVMLGINEEEGTLLMLSLLPYVFGQYGRNIENSLSRSRAFAITRSMLLILGQRNATEIEKHYAQYMTNHTTIGYAKMIANIIGDYSISCNTLFFADFLSLKGNSVYYYKFGFRAASSPMADWVGTTHLDEIQYVFGNPYHENFTDEEIELSHRMIDRWSAFARTGKPNIPGHMPWQRYSFNNPLYMSFGQEEESVLLHPSNTCSIWRKRFKADFDSDLIEFLKRSGENTGNSN